MPIAFAVLFPSTTGLVVFGAVFGLVFGLRSGHRAAGLALRSATAAVGAFVVVVCLMDLAGWRVGAPDAESRFTMLVVTALGVLAATTAGGAAVGGFVAPARPIGRHRRRLALSERSHQQCHR